MRAGGLQINEEGQRVESANKVKVLCIRISFLFLGFFLFLLLHHHLPPPTRAAGTVSADRDAHQSARTPPTTRASGVFVM